MGLGIWSGIRKAPLTIVDRILGVRLEWLLVKLLEHRIVRLSPTESLKLLFRLDDAMYAMQGKQSVAYDGGLHTKHRHIRYHDFFVNRITDCDRVIDIGCGIGKLAYEVATRSGARVTAVDYVERSIAIAKERFAHPRVEFVVGDVTKELEGGPFDVVILSNVLEHLNERPRFLKRLQDVIAPKRYLIRVPLFERDWRVPLKKELGVEWRLDQDHKTEYTLESFDEEIAESGLDFTYREVRWGEIWAELKPK